MNVTYQKESGSFFEKSRVTYLFSLPVFHEPCPMKDLTEKIKEAFLSFLLTESKNAWEETRFGGLRFEKKADGFLILSAFSPFTQRRYFPCAKLLCDDKGNLLDVKFIKKSSLPPEAD